VSSVTTLDKGSATATGAGLFLEAMVAVLKQGIGLGGPVHLRERGREKVFS